MQSANQGNHFENKNKTILSRFRKTQGIIGGHRSQVSIDIGGHKYLGESKSFFMPLSLALLLFTLLNERQ
jgi:hypothetical protein